MKDEEANTTWYHSGALFSNRTGGYGERGVDMYGIEKNITTASLTSSYFMRLHMHLCYFVYLF